ncbi:MAG: glycosyl transferase group 1, partial [Frankiales bacterium]|nr:glycosyl transferase group 1 [Frankiales bacterium]
MRIVVVSAHYPPDFVSGGTLVPQRHARAMRERGHDVRVYAGSLSLTEPVDETDETGLPVRWVPVRDGIGWSSSLNADNPRVVADFAAWLAEVRPEVVHLHALQSMGGPMVRAAKEAGARVVVTMHDFWWSCGRQFLVDKGFRPCSLVVEAGVCGCEVDRPWLDDRNARLAADLALADAVCVPSTIARDLVAANGLAPGVLLTDENGLPHLAVSGSPTTSETVRFLFAGGKNRLKGGPLLLDAVANLQGEWALTVVGQELRVETELPITFAPPYRPDSLSEVLHAHDVLVLPSLMRESFSIVTREALLHGLTVITSDTLGPEEVITHGVNGLVVATGSAPDLAAAMQALIDDAALLRRLRTSPPPAVRSLADQVMGLERLYGATPPRPVPSAVRNVLFICGIEGAPLRYRAHLPAEALALQGIHSEVRHYRSSDLQALAARSDVIVVYRVPATTQLLELLGSATVP